MKISDLDLLTLKEIFEKIYENRGGEMLLIHVNRTQSIEDPDVKCFMTVKNDSLLMSMLPHLVMELCKDD